MAGWPCRSRADIAPGGAACRTAAGGCGRGFGSQGRGEVRRSRGRFTASVPSPKARRNQALQGGVSPPESCRGRGASPSRRPSTPARVGARRPERARQLRRATPGQRRARNRERGTCRGRGGMARAGGSGAVTKSSGKAGGHVERGDPAAERGDPAVDPPATKTLLIGLIGPIGAGKSTVAGWLAERGVVIVDADRLTRELMAPGTPVTAAVFARFGERFRLLDGSLDRRALGRLVFSDPTRLDR